MKQSRYSVVVCVGIMMITVGEPVLPSLDETLEANWKVEWS